MIKVSAEKSTSVGNIDGSSDNGGYSNTVIGAENTVVKGVERGRQGDRWVGGCRVVLHLAGALLPPVVAGKVVSISNFPTS